MSNKNNDDLKRQASENTLGLIDIAAAQTASHYLRGDTSRANSTRETLTRLNTTLGKLLELDSVE